jgi:choline dehydrogenase-like flavoprotein
MPSADSPLTIAGVVDHQGDRYFGNHVLLGLGALHSPRLLQRYIEDHELTALSSYGNVGRNLKLHLLTAMLAVSPSVKRDLLRKTALFVSERVPHSSVQPLGFDGELMGTLVPKFVPRPLARAIGNRAYGFFLQTEDGSHPDNRIVAAPDGELPRFDYDATRLDAALREHRRLVRTLARDLLMSGYAAFAQRIPVTGTAHACGTLVAGADPAHSVVDANGRAHAFSNLFVVDGSVLARSSRVNPALTIYAWALRVAQQLTHTKVNHESETARLDPLRA